MTLNQLLNKKYPKDMIDYGEDNIDIKLITTKISKQIDLFNELNFIKWFGKV